MLTLVNGEEISLLPVTDRGLQYGDGLYETVAMRSGSLQHWDLHMKRLETGGQKLALPIPDTRLLRREAERVSADTGRAVVRITITRGSSARGYRPPAKPEISRIIQGLPWPDYPQHFWHQGISVRWCKQQLARQPQLAGFKHLNRLEQVMARAEWQDEYAEGLMRDTDGLVISGTMSNLFLVHAGTLITPDLSHSGINGIMRANILRIAQQLAIPHTVQPVTPAMVAQADELFLTNSLIGIWPIAQLEARRYVVAGKITQTLQKALDTHD